MPDFSFEAGAPRPVCGIDEAGRGPWAGPVVAAAVVLDPAAVPYGLDDSKRLTPERSATRSSTSSPPAPSIGVGQASVAEIGDDEHPAGELPRHAPRGRRARPPAGAGAGGRRG